MNHHRPDGIRGGTFGATLTAAAALALALLGPGCIAVAAGAVGAGIVAASGEDTAQIDLRAEVKDVIATAREVVEREGNVEFVRTDDEAGDGIVLGEIDGSSVKVLVFPMKDLVRVRVTCRQVEDAFPDLDLAEQIARSIAPPHL